MATLNMKLHFFLLNLVLGTFLISDAWGAAECPFDAPWLSESTSVRILNSLSDHKQKIVITEDSDTLLLQLFLWSKLLPNDSPLIASEGFSLDPVANRNENQLNGLVWLVAHSAELSEELNLSVEEKSDTLEKWIEEEFSSNPHQIIGLSRFREARFGLPSISLEKMLENVNGPVGEVFFHISSELESRGRTEDAYAALRVAVEYSELRGFLGLFDFYISKESCRDRAQVAQWINRALWLDW